MEILKKIKHVLNNSRRERLRRKIVLSETLLRLYEGRINMTKIYLTNDLDESERRKVQEDLELCKAEAKDEETELHRLIDELKSLD